MDHLKLAKSQTTKMTQIKNNKTSPIKQQRYCEEMKAYISNKIKMYA